MYGVFMFVTRSLINQISRNMGWILDYTLNIKLLLIYQSKNHVSLHTATCKVTGKS